ncbi:MAG: TonB-dependent receptor [Cytophagaceae bacterium]|nr:TonB-dependent receptor [Cytophagaceae bacterium]MBP6093585.1 TonB-dependent receptor [Cytophagaceae bacterium]
MLVIFVFLFLPFNHIDSTAKSTFLSEVIVKHEGIPANFSTMPSVKNGIIYSGKKSELIRLGALPANVSERVGRQVFAKIPGAFIYDMDGSGNQMNFAFRGLDSHRGWEFNIRQDGVLLNSDLYGYPASHYSMPLESIESIEIVRGTGSLQYGAQFGGMVNYVTKKPSKKSFSLENITSIGSFNTYTNYSSVSGTSGKFSYLGYVSNRSADGFRDQTHSQFDAQHIRLNYAFHQNLNMSVSWSRSNYLFKMAGPLTDVQFAQNPKQSTRSRNYFNPSISIPAVELNWNPCKNSTVKFSSSFLYGDRNSVLFDKTADVLDLASNGIFASRQVDIDNFNSWTNELRFLQSYKKGTLTLGIQYLSNDLRRRQLGKGSTGTDFDLSITAAGFVRDMHMKTENLAFFLEHKWDITDRLSWNAGVRFESGETNMSGVIAYLDASQVVNKITHRFPLYGTSFEYQINKAQQIYGGISQAFRPVIFKDIIPASTYDRADKNLQDAKGYNVELGYRGTWRNFQWDITGFQLQYDNRLGKLAQTDAQGNFSLLQTNIGNSITTGVEISLQTEFSLAPKITLSLFTATSQMNARYQNASIRNGTTNVSIAGNYVESAPEWISRNGMTIRFRQYSISGLYSYVAKSYADALNTEKPSANGAVGAVPAYSLLDFVADWKISKSLLLKASINNALDLSYFTKRPMFYPGPGIWPSDGRSFQLSLQVKL